ncbi:MAG TPA: prolipoprotein diacylglyceryl transferase [Vicinamibacterales bacterium]|nr:prolipoprotein diacylglyceryl transferase [Vicinamibacterales bacterium]
MTPGPFVHRLDPVLPMVGSIGGVYLWWYGLSYTFGFLHVLLYVRSRRAALGLSRRDAYALALCFCAGVLLGGRAVQVAFDEWPLYRAHPQLLPAFWLGGMATHGLLLGALGATVLYARWKRLSFLALADALVIPGALLLGLGRLGNFIDGQIVGRVTDVWWAVKFPDADGFRHPVVLYDGLKNLLLVPYLLRVRRTNPTPGAVAARFVFWYASLRIAIDLFRDYPTFRLALGTGQTLNIVMMTIGLVLLYRSRLRRQGRLSADRGGTARTPPAGDEKPLAVQRLAFALLLLFCLTIPSNWTQDVPVRYASRHPGMTRTWLYPSIDTARYRTTTRSPDRRITR